MAFGGGRDMRDSWSDSCTSSYNLRPCRPLTGPALQTYDQTKEQYWNALTDIYNEGCSLIHSLEDSQYSFSDIKTPLSQKIDQYRKTSDLFSRYLKTTRHLDCDQEIYLNNSKLQTFQQLVDIVFQKHDNMKVTVKESETSKSELENTVIETKPEINNENETSRTETEQKMTTKHSVPVKAERPKSTKTKSIKKSIRSKLSKLSKHSDKSNESDLSAKYVTQKAKVEELKVRMNYVKKEAELLKQKAEIEESMKVLNTEREFKECEQANRVFEEYLEESNEEESDDENLNQVQHDRVEQFVEDQNRLKENFRDPLHVTTPSVQNETHKAPEHRPPTDRHILNASATPFVSTSETLAKFMIKRDFLLKGIQKFDDTPQYFGAWKRSFTEKIKQLDLNPGEEVDTLIDYLGPESSKSAKIISSANLNDTEEALRLIWERLHDMYAKPEMIESSIKGKLTSFRRIGTKEFKRLYDLVDIVIEIQSVKADPIFSSLFSYFDSSVGVNLIVTKLSYQLQEKWTTEASRYKETYFVSYPPFSVFVEVLRRMARMKNDPSFLYDESQPVSGSKTTRSYQHSVDVKKTEIPAQNFKQTVHECPIHKTNHTLNKCRMFRQKPIKERVDFVKNQEICLKCCGEKPHLARNCQTSVLCEKCNSRNHHTALHVDRNFDEKNLSKNNDQILTQNKAETELKTKRQQPQVTTKCTEICKNPMGTSKFCAKTVLCRVYPKDNPTNSLLLYSIIDEQSNRSLATSSFFAHFDIQGPELPYSLSSCTGNSTEYGRRVSDFVVESFSGCSRMNLPTLIECNQIPNNRQEIPSRDVALGYSHLQDIASYIPDLNDNADIMLLIGRDLLTAHHVLDQKLGPPHLPYAQKTRLGWVIVGESCSAATHEQDSVCVMKTFTLKDGRTTSLEPCLNEIKAFDEPLFIRTRDDNEPGLSVNDKHFLSFMSQQSHRDEQGSWTAPLPVL